METSRMRDTDTAATTTSKNGRTAHVTEAANKLIDEGKKLAGEMYQDGLKKVKEAEGTMEEYSDQMLQKVKENPLTSVLVAVGIGFLLSLFIKK